jgi:hypothetical protein
VPIANAVPLDQVADDMASRGMIGTGNVIVDRTRETGFLCVGYYMDEPGWDRLAMLRDTYGSGVCSRTPATSTRRRSRATSSRRASRTAGATRRPATAAPPRRRRGSRRRTT